MIGFKRAKIIFLLSFHKLFKNSIISWSKDPKTFGIITTLLKLDQIYKMRKKTFKMNNAKIS